MAGVRCRPHPIGDDGGVQGVEAVIDLTPEEVRVLGCLIEKEATTPDNYPLTLNSLRNACNQSTSRDPVVEYGEREIEQALTSLRRRGLTRTVHSTSNRATKYRHVLPEVLDLAPDEVAVLSVLMLRGAQTIGELKGRTERQHRFATTDEVAATLAALATREQAMVRQLERQPGQKDARWIHLLGDVPEPSGAVAAPQPSTSVDDSYGAATAEFYDLLATDMWTSFGLQLLDLLADADPSAGPVIDIGVGTGIGLQYVRAAVPDADVFAVEPSKAMRAALHARLTDDPDLRTATTVAPTRFIDARLPPTASAVVASAVYGHLTDDERRRLWRYVAEQMPAGAPAVIGVLPPDRPVAFEPVRYARVPVGAYVYEGWQSGQPIDDRSMSWTLSYRVVDDRDGTTIADYRASAPWRCDSVDDVRHEIAEFGLTLTEHDGCVVVRRPG
jgi:uncharacterized protein YceH (UPF0502 family)